MLIGPVFTRETSIAPRRTRTYVARAAYVFVLLLLTLTAWLVLTGTQIVRNLGDFARFGTVLFHMLAPLQLALSLFLAAMAAASAVAQEKDRRTMVLLLLTNMTNAELVLGKLLASLLHVLTMLLAAVPMFMLLVLLGGVSFGQVGRVFAVTLATVLLAGSLGSTVALWREKTFQALAMTALAIVFWLGFWEFVASGGLGGEWLGVNVTTWAAGFSPWQAIHAAASSQLETDPALGPLGNPVGLFLLIAAVLVLALNGAAILRVRAWNTATESREFRREDETWNRQSLAADEVADPQAQPVAQPDAPTLTARHRVVWDNPILWREMRTWAYGRRVLLVRLVYWVIFALLAGLTVSMVAGGEPLSRVSGAIVLVPLFLLSMVLINAQAVTAITGERDARALDLLLVSDLSPKEIVFGKLGGIFYNTKEMVFLPILLCLYLGATGTLGWENLLYLVGGLLVLFVFSAVLGVHAGMSYNNSGSAIATSLGTLFFLFLGVATCMRMMVAFGSFQTQLQAFLAFMVGGGIGLYTALGSRNPSHAIGLASFLCPFATFYAIVSFLLNFTLGVFLVMAGAYGFMTLAMLVPAVYEFDVATGRTTAGEQSE